MVDASSFIGGIGVVVDANLSKHIANKQQTTHQLEGADVGPVVGRSVVDLDEGTDVFEITEVDLQ